MSAIVPPEKRRKPGPAKGTRPAGRKLGTKNKATVARELQAAQQILQAQSKDHESALAVLSRLLADLDRFKQLAEGAAGFHRPPTVEELAAAQEAEDAIAEQEGREAAGAKAPPQKVPAVPPEAPKNGGQSGGTQDFAASRPSAGVVTPAP